MGAETSKRPEKPISPKTPSPKQQKIGLATRLSFRKKPLAMPKENLPQIIAVQALFRGYSQSFRFQLLRSATIKLQARGRGFIQRNRYKNTKRCKFIAKEILSTERAYVNNLRILREVLAEPIIKKVKKKTFKITADELKAIFNCCDIIRTFHIKFLENLEKKVSNWTAFTVIGDCFLELAGFLKIYTQYINNYNLSMQTLDACKLRDKGFKNFLEKQAQSAKTQHLPIDALLIAPISRIPRYVLLLTDIVKHTPKDYRDYAYLAKALKEIQGIALLINERKRAAESKDAAREIFVSITPPQNDLIQPTRYLVHKGPLSLITPSEEGPPQIEKVFVFLFNDLIILTSPLNPDKTYALLQKYPVVTIKLASLTEKVAQFKNAFELSISKGKSLLLSSETPEQKDEWISQIIGTNLRHDRESLMFVSRIIKNRASSKKIVNQSNS